MERSKKQRITKNDDNLEWNFETRKEHQRGIFNTNNSRYIPLRMKYVKFNVKYLQIYMKIN